MHQAFLRTSRRPARLLYLAGLTLLLGSGQLHAQAPAGECGIGPGLGSTLLIPYFEVDPSSANGKTTLISVNNGVDRPVLVRVVVWTDWGIPTLAFDIFLAEHDIQTINLRDMFNGHLPSTGAGADLGAYRSCDRLPPTYGDPAFPAPIRNELMAFHSGAQGAFTELCAGENWGDHVARGYVTVDAVWRCSGAEWIYPNVTPANATLPYFVNHSGSSGVGRIANQLWGDVLYLEPEANVAQGTEAISLWADASLFDGSHIFTFYGRYSGWDGRDDRVPLPYRWHQRFMNGGLLAGGANMIVWRDTGSAAAAPVSCLTGPAWRPMRAICNTTDEDAGNFHVAPNTAFPVATQRVDVSTLAIPYAFGLLVVDTRWTQSWVQATMTAQGRFSATVNGTPVYFLCDRTPP